MASITSYDSPISYGFPFLSSVIFQYPSGDILNQSESHVSDTAHIYKTKQTHPDLKMSGMWLMFCAVCSSWGYLRLLKQLTAWSRKPTYSRTV